MSVLEMLLTQDSNHDPIKINVETHYCVTEDQDVTIHQLGGCYFDLNYNNRRSVEMSVEEFLFWIKN